MRSVFSVSIGVHRGSACGQVQANSGTLPKISVWDFTRWRVCTIPSVLVDATLERNHVPAEIMMDSARPTIEEPSDCAPHGASAKEVPNSIATVCGDQTSCGSFSKRQFMWALANTDSLPAVPGPLDAVARAFPSIVIST